MTALGITVFTLLCAAWAWGVVRGIQFIRERKMEKFKFNLGDKVKDKVTGYTGIIIGQTRWLYGCTRYTIQAQELKDGKPVEAISCDEAALDVVEPVPVKDPVRKSGGPTREPSRGPSAARGR